MAGQQQVFFRQSPDTTDQSLLSLITAAAVAGGIGGTEFVTVGAGS
jgi:hypothetical protein